MDINNLKSIKGMVMPVIKYNPYPYDPKFTDTSISRIWNSAILRQPNLKETTIFENYVSKWNNDTLRSKSSKFDTITDGVRYLAASLQKTLYFYNAAGISAPQVGINKRMIVINNTLNFKNLSESDTLVLINPEIISDYTQEELVNGMEGCLSFPEAFVAVLRPKTITVRYKDLDGNELETVFSNDQAREILHEIDHLDGILIVDNVSRLKKNLILDKLKKMYASGDIFNDVIALDAFNRLQEVTQ